MHCSSFDVLLWHDCVWRENGRLLFHVAQILTTSAGDRSRISGIRALRNKDRLALLQWE